QGSMKIVGSSPDNQVDSKPAGRLRDVLAGRGDLYLLEIVVVEVERRGPRRKHVGDDDTVERPDGVEWPRAFRYGIRLLTRLVAGDVDAIEQDSRHRTK